MKKVTDLHRQAMDLVDQARMAKVHGDSSHAEKLLREAFEKERSAALLVEGKKDLEPTRSVLCRSAATLALQCKEIREAERLITLGLSGNPPEEVAEEMRDLLEDVYFERHLQLRDVALEPDEIQLSLAGDSVGFGMASARIFVERVESMENLLYRTAERKLGRPYRDRGKAKTDIKEQFEVYMSVPRAASFAVTLRLGHSQQMVLPGLDWSENIVDEVLDCFDLFISDDTETLNQRINDPAYYRNFIGLARKIAPDGEKVRTVGITTIRQGKERHVALREAPRPLVKSDSKEEVEVIAKHAEVAHDARKQIEGSLLFADSTKNEREIRIVDKQGKTHRVRVPEGLMDDIVRPMWDTVVIVVGLEQDGILVLEDIKKAET